MLTGMSMYRYTGWFHFQVYEVNNVDQEKIMTDWKNDKHHIPENKFKFFDLRVEHVSIEKAPPVPKHCVPHFPPFPNILWKKGQGLIKMDEEEIKALMETAANMDETGGGRFTFSLEDKKGSS